MRSKYVCIEVASARGVADRWKSQYYDNRDSQYRWLKTVSGSSEDIYNKLCDLGQNPSIDRVADIIGNKSWSYICCDGCNSYVERAVRICSEYNEGKVYCQICIEEARQVLLGEER